MKDEQIKALVKEAIEEDRKEQQVAKKDHFITGLSGALIFLMSLPFILTAPPFVGGLWAGGITIFDIVFIRWAVKSNYEIRQYKSLKQVN
jgi:hypothetical protein